jgi:fructose-1,6-bisphosphatase I
MYPGTAKKPAGKLRLMYECNPFAFIIEVAGGKASSGNQRILDIQPEDLHQRTPVFIGSKNMVDECLSYLTSHPSPSRKAGEPSS